MQSENERAAVIEQFPWPASLAPTIQNADLLGSKMAEKYGEGDWTLEGLLSVFQELGPKLQWLSNRPEEVRITVVQPAPDSTPATPKLKGDFTDRLLQVGVRPASGVNHADNSVEQAKKAKWDGIKDASAVRQRRQNLIGERERANAITIHRDDGRIDHGASCRARQDALQKVNQQIEQFNLSVSTDLRIK